MKYLICKYVQGGEEYHVDAGSPIALTCVIGLEDTIIQSFDENRSWVQEESKSSFESFIGLQFFDTLFKNKFLILRIDAKPASICFLVS